MIKRKYFWRLIGLIYIGALVYLLFSSPDKLPTIKNWDFIIPADKLVHFCMFFPSPIILYLSIGKEDYSTHRILFCTIVCILLAAITELLQGLSPTRSMEFFDFVADSSGIILSSALLHPLLKKVFGKSKTRSN